VVLIKRYLLFIFGNFEQALNGFYEMVKRQNFPAFGRFVLSDGSGGGMEGTPDFSFQVS
jgi:hypothetical protein